MAANPYAGPMTPWPSLAAYGRRVTIAGRTPRQLFIFEAGEAAAPTMVLVHGLGDEADTWRHVFGPLAEQHHVIALDLPGFGRSDPAQDYSLPMLRDALLGLLDALRLPAATLVGSSLGAMVAHRLAVDAPDRVTGLVLVDGALILTSGAFNWGALLMALPLVGERIYNNYRRDPQSAYNSLRPFYGNLQALPAADRQFLFQRVNERVWSDRQRRAYLGLYRYLAWSAPRQQKGTAAALSKLSVPTHLVWGEHDHIMPLSAARAVIALQPGARLSIIPAAGHLPHQEQPAAFLAALAPESAIQPA